MTKNLFSGSFMDMLDSKDSLIVLANNFPWSKIEEKFKNYYKNDKVGSPYKSIRLMVGLLLLKQLKNLSDERNVEEWKQNPYLQYFCGFTEYTPSLPCHATELVKFRNRGVEDVLIFAIERPLHSNTLK